MNGDAPLFAWRKAIVSSDLKPSSRHVALTLALHMDANGGSCFPSLALIAAETGLSKSTVAIALNELEQRGWVKRERSGDEGASGEGRPFQDPGHSLHGHLPHRSVR